METWVSYRVAAGAGEMGGNGGGRVEATQGLPTFRHENGMAGMRLHVLMMNMRHLNMTKDLTHVQTKHKTRINGTSRARYDERRGRASFFFQCQNFSFPSPIPLLGKPV